MMRSTSSRNLSFHTRYLQYCKNPKNWATCNNYCNYPKTIEPLHDKTNKMTCAPAKTRISLDICPVWSESSLCAQWVAKDPSFLHADSEDSDQIGRMPRLIWVFAGRTCHFVGFVMRRLSLFYHTVMHPKGADETANSEDNSAASEAVCWRSSLFWISSVCLDLGQKNYMCISGFSSEKTRYSRSALHFILSRYFIWILHFLWQFSSFSSIFDNNLFTIHNKIFRVRAKT